MFTSIDLTGERFRKDLQSLPPEVRAEARAKFKMVLEIPPRRCLRLHHMKGHDIYKIDLTPSGRKGPCYQASFKVVDGVAVFLRAGTHKEMDRIY